MILKYVCSDQVQNNNRYESTVENGEKHYYSDIDEVSNILPPYCFIGVRKLFLPLCMFMLNVFCKSTKEDTVHS